MQKRIENEIESLKCLKNNNNILNMLDFLVIFSYEQSIKLTTIH